MATRTVRFIGTQNLLLDRLLQDLQSARNAVNNTLMICLAELGVPEGVQANFEELIRDRSFTWEVADVSKEQPTDGPKVEGV